MVAWKPLTAYSYTNELYYFVKEMYILSHFG